jgi:hypothetical protein
LQKLSRLSLQLVKSLAGNDDVKAQIGKHGIAPIIVSAMQQHEVFLITTLPPIVIFIFTAL